MKVPDELLGDDALQEHIQHRFTTSLRAFIKNKI